MRKCSFIPTLLGMALFATGQPNFVSSVVINNNGDTIYGSINYRNWKTNPSTVEFLNAANQKQTFDATAIKGFSIPSMQETYTSFTVHLDLLPDDKDEAINNSFVDSSGARKRVFLLQLVKHPTLSLYLFATQKKDHFYYMRGSEEPVELIHHYVYDEISKQIVETAKYKEQLAGIFASCPEMVTRASSIRFRQNDIQGIILKYLQCSAPGSLTDIKKKDPVSFGFGIVGGVMFNQFDFKGSDVFLADENYSGNVSPVLGISLDMSLSRNLGKWHIINELIYKVYKTDNSFTRPYGIGYTVKIDVDMSFSYVQLNTLVRYVFLPHALVKPNINFGIGNAVLVAENKNSSDRSYSFGGDEDQRAIDGPRKYELSFLGGVGLTVRSNIQFELRYSGSHKSFSPYHDLDVNATSFQFVVTYHF